MYFKKYTKYKHKYQQLKKLRGGQEHDYGFHFHSRKVDWNLFFDLLDVSNNIISSTSPTDIIILVGDTPSYLKPFLETIQNERKIYNFASSNKPFGCFAPPFSVPLSDPSYKSVYTPTQPQLESYFNYLNTKTALTKDFIKKNWRNRN